MQTNYIEIFTQAVKLSRQYPNRVIFFHEYGSAEGRFNFRFDQEMTEAQQKECAFFRHHCKIQNGQILDRTLVEVSAETYQDFLDQVSAITGIRILHNDCQTEPNNGPTTFRAIIDDVCIADIVFDGFGGDCTIKRRILPSAVIVESR